jgi:bifunctional ADP-heptose synthase (sugar kinase/adenylyltransferase)
MVKLQPRAQNQKVYVRHGLTVLHPNFDSVAVIVLQQKRNVNLDQSGQGSKRSLDAVPVVCSSKSTACLITARK